MWTWAELNRRSYNPIRSVKVLKLSTERKLAPYNLVFSNRITQVNNLPRTQIQLDYSYTLQFSHSNSISILSLVEAFVTL